MKISLQKCLWVRMACLILWPIVQSAQASDLVQSLANCKNGRQSCDRSGLTKTQSAEVARADQQRNLSNCRDGFESCDRSKLSAREADGASAWRRSHPEEFRADVAPGGELAADSDTDEQAKLIFYSACIEGKRDAPKGASGKRPPVVLQPEYPKCATRTMWSLSNAFTSAFKKLDPIPQFKATANLGEFLSSSPTDSVVAVPFSSQPQQGPLRLRTRKLFKIDGSGQSGAANWRSPEGGLIPSWRRIIGTRWVGAML
jgi:hypothetical protein